ASSIRRGVRCGAASTATARCISRQAPPAFDVEASRFAEHSPVVCAATIAMYHRGVAPPRRPTSSRHVGGVDEAVAAPPDLQEPGSRPCYGRLLRCRWWLVAVRAHRLALPSIEPPRGGGPIQLTARRTHVAPGIPRSMSARVQEDVAERVP